MSWIFNADFNLRQDDLLSSLRIAAPCNINWESMTGDDRIRHCSQCNKNVYNISLMTRTEANEFLKATGNQACLNFYKHSDGTIIIDNCPIGLRKMRSQYKNIVAAIGLIISLAQGFILSVFAGDEIQDRSEFSQGAPQQDDPGITHLRGEPAAMAEPKSISLYREKIKPIIAAAMPKTDLGHAAFSFAVESSGKVQQVRLVNPSPDKHSDKLILESVSKLKLPLLPKDYTQQMLPVYYECQQATK